MSNLTLFKSGSNVPEYLRGGTDATTREMAGGSGGKQISIKGGVWRMIVGGEEVSKNEDRAMNLVVVAAAKGVARTFYAEKFEEGVNASPSCWSAEGVIPDAEVAAPQSASCATCRQNIEGSGEGKSRACRYSKRLAVALEGDLSGNVYRMIVPAKSYFGRADGDKMPLQAYSKFLAGHSIPITGIVTEARFDTAEAVPVLKFRAVRPLTEAEWGVAKAQGQSEEARSAVEFKMTPSSAQRSAQPALPSSFTAPPATQAAEPAEPVRRAAKKPPESAPAPSKDIAAVLADWGTDDE
jgi:hypothetical protein